MFDFSRMDLKLFQFKNQLDIRMWLPVQCSFQSCDLKIKNMTETDDCSKSFETILYQSGKFGSYQRRLYAITCVMHIVCSSILTYLKFIPRQILRKECTEVLQADGNETILFLDVNETVTYPTTCRTYYENNQGLEDDQVFPEVRSTSIISPKRKSCMFCGGSRDIKMAVIGDFIKQNLKQRGQLSKV